MEKERKNDFLHKQNRMADTRSHRRGNCEKYLKDGVDIENFTNSLCGFDENWDLRNIMYSGIKNFLKKEAKPILTEDEKVILRNITKEYLTIARNFAGELSARNNDDWSYIEVFNHLFQFIKERRRIRDRGVTK